MSLKCLSDTYKKLAFIYLYLVIDHFNWYMIKHLHACMFLMNVGWHIYACLLIYAFYMYLHVLAFIYQITYIIMHQISKYLSTYLRSHICFANAGRQPCDHKCNGRSHYCKAVAKMWRNMRLQLKYHPTASTLWRHFISRGCLANLHDCCTAILRQCETVIHVCCIRMSTYMDLMQMCRRFAYDT